MAREFITDDEHLVDIARRIAGRAPRVQKENTFSCLIPWAQLNELRRVLDDLNVDWRG